MSGDVGFSRRDQPFELQPTSYLTYILISTIMDRTYDSIASGYLNTRLVPLLDALELYNGRKVYLSPQLAGAVAQLHLLDQDSSVHNNQVTTHLSEPSTPSEII